MPAVHQDPVTVPCLAPLPKPVFPWCHHPGPPPYMCQHLVPPPNQCLLLVPSPVPPPEHVCCRVITIHPTTLINWMPHNLCWWLLSRPWVMTRAKANITGWHRTSLATFRRFACQSVSYLLLKKFSDGNTSMVCTLQQWIVLQLKGLSTSLALACVGVELSNDWNEYSSLKFILLVAGKWRHHCGIERSINILTVL